VPEYRTCERLTAVGESRCELIRHSQVDQQVWDIHVAAHGVDKNTFRFDLTKRRLGEDSSQATAISSLPSSP